MEKIPFTLRVAQIEEEEGQSFFEVLSDLAASGESKSSTASMLGLPQTTLCQYLRNVGPPFSEIAWPKKGQSNGFMANVTNNTAARQAARLRNLSLTRHTARS